MLNSTEERSSKSACLHEIESGFATGVLRWCLNDKTSVAGYLCYSQSPVARTVLVMVGGDGAAFFDCEG